MTRSLLYLPGLDGTGRLLYRQQQLHEQYDVRCVSFPQDKLLRYEELADLGVQALEASATAGRSVILAESFGGAVALTLALRRPELVERLVLVNTFAYFPRRLWLHLSVLASRFFPPRPSHPATRGVRGHFFFSREVSPADRNEWWERTAEVPMSGYALRLKVISELDLRPRLREIDVPALVLVAPDDRVVPAAAGRDLARRLPRARKLEMRVGHAALAHPRVNVAELLADPSYWAELASTSARAST